MTVIIRLQNLPWTANALDIRRFFQGLGIPDGGVHIVGGEKGDAFIAFSTDEDARQAMYLDNGRVCDTPIKLFLSSKAEMQTVIAVARGATPVAAPGPSPSRSDISVASKPSVGLPSTQQNVPEINRINTFSKQPVGIALQDRMADMGQSSGRNRSGDGSYFQQSQPENRSMGGSLTRTEAPRMGGVQRSQQGEGSDWGASGSGRMVMESRETSAYDRPRGDTRMGNDRMRPEPERVSGGSNQMEHSGSDWRKSAPSAIGGTSNSGRMSEPLLGNRPNQASSGPDRSGYHDRSERFDQGNQMAEHRGDYHGHFDSHSGDGDRTRRQGGGDRYDGGQRGDGGRMSDSRDRGNTEHYQSQGQSNYDRQDQGSRFRESTNRGSDRGGQQNFSQQNTQRGEGYDNRGSRFEGGDDYNRREQDDWGEQSGSWSASYDQRDQQMDSSYDNNDRRYRDSGNYDNNGGGEGYGNDYGEDDGYDGQYEGEYDEYYDEDYDGNERWNQGDAFEDDGQMNEYRGHMNRGGSSHRDMDYNRNDNFSRGRGGFRGRGMRGRGDFRGRGRGRGRGGFDQDRGGYNWKRRDLYVYLSNMPETVSYRDIRRFFRGLEVPHDGLKVINDKQGNRVGTAYVCFGSENDCQAALKRNDQTMGNRRVKIEKCQMSDFEKAIDSYVPGTHGSYRSSSPPAKRFRSRSPPNRSRQRDLLSKHDGSNCVVMKNVHYRATRLDVRHFLGKIKIHSDGGPHIILGKDGRPTGTVFVELDSKNDFDDTLKCHNRTFMNRTVEIYPLTKKEFDQRSEDPKKEEKENSRKSDAGDETRDKKSEKNNTSDVSDKKFFCVKMKGIPYSATNDSIREFFGEDLPISNRGLHLVTNKQGQATGTAFVEFVASSDCKKALEKDKQYMGKRYIELSPITKKDMLEELQEEQQRASGSGPASRHPLKSVPDLPGVSRPGCTITMSNLPFKVQLEDIMAFLDSCRPIQDSVRLRYSKDGKPTGDAMVTFQNPGDARRAINELNRTPMMGRSVMLAMAP